MTEARAPLPRLVVVALGLAGLVVAIAGLHAVAGLFAPVFLALTLVVCVHPLLVGLQRRGCPSWLAVTVCLVILFVVVLGLVVAVVLSVARFAQLLADRAGDSQDFVDSVSRFLHRQGVSDSQIHSALNAIDPGRVLGLASTLLSGLAHSLTSLVLILATAFFMVADAVDLPRRLDIVARDRPQIAASFGAFASGVRRYWLVSTVFGLVVAVLDTAALFAIGVPLALVWGLLSFLTNYIPNVGFVLGLVPPALLALIDGGIGDAVLVVAIYVVLNVVIQVVIQPRFTGSAVGLTVTASFLSLVFWGFVLGPLGGLLALPMSLAVKTLLIDPDPRARWFGALVAARGADARST